MYRIKCSNGKYVQKTTYGTWITYTKKGKVFSSENLAKKNLELCEEFANKSDEEKYNSLNYQIESVN